jgi:hypothetical protein
MTLGQSLKIGAVASARVAQRVAISTARAAEWTKQRSEPYLDYALMVTATNASLLAGTAAAVAYTDVSRPTDGLLCGAAGVAALYVNRRLVGNQKQQSLLRKVNFWQRTNRAVAWGSTTLLAGATYLAVGASTPYVKPVVHDVREGIESLVNPGAPQTPIVTETPAAENDFHSLGYTERVSDDLRVGTLAPKPHVIGRIQRMERWRPLINAVADRYKLPRNTLAAMVMEESYGDPLQGNSTRDGGVGLLHMQGTTAKEYGLRIHGESFNDTDFQHGEEIARMVAECDYDPTCAQQFDERMHIIKNLDAGARIIRRGMRNTGSVEAGVRYFRGGNNKTRANYYRRIRGWQQQLESPAVQQAVATDFARRNGGQSVQDYWAQFHRTAVNWDLEKYNALPPQNF